MVVSCDIGNIAYQDCCTLAAELGVSEVYQGAAVPRGEVVQPRIVVHVDAPSDDKHFRECFLNVNICVPDIGEMADLTTLGEYEREAWNFFEALSEAQYDGDWYGYEPQSATVESDAEMRCHYVNVKVLFFVLIR